MASPGSRPQSGDTASRTGTRRKILLLGPRRAGKSSLCKVVYQSYQPNDTLFLAPTARTQKLDVKTFQKLEIWDMPGSALQQFSTGTHSTGVAPPAESAVEIPWAEVSAIIFVVDAQDDYFDALSKLNQVILVAYKNSPSIHFHIFINKVDGLSDDYKYDTQRDIEQRVYEELIDSSHEFQGPAGEPVQLDTEVNIRFHLTSVFDSSVFVAFSRIQQRLMQNEGGADTSRTTDAEPDAPEHLVSLHDAIESACNSLCASCLLEKAYVFDVPSRTFIGCDTSPFDLPLFDVMFEYIKFLSQFSALYSDVAQASGAKATRKWSASVVRLGSDTSVAFWQLDNHLALLATVRTSVHVHNLGILVRALTHPRTTTSTASAPRSPRSDASPPHSHVIGSERSSCDREDERSRGSSRRGAAECACARGQVLRDLLVPVRVLRIWLVIDQVQGEPGGQGPRSLCAAVL